jgi:hypothetical protein
MKGHGSKFEQKKEEAIVEGGLITTGLCPNQRRRGHRTATATDIPS